MHIPFLPWSEFEEVQPHMSGTRKKPVFKGTIFSPSLQIISYDSSDNENKEKNTPAIC